MVPVRLPIALAALSLSACVLDPFSGTALPPAATEVTFRGLAAYQPGVRMRVLLQEESGALTPLGEASVATSGAWTATVAVPDRAWARPPCGAARFVFRGSNGTTAYGQDAACIAAAGPGATAEQRLACLVPSVELFRGRVHAGDLTVTGQAEADANACVTVVDGNLTVDGGRVAASGSAGYAAGLTFAMPQLKEVRGRLSVDGGRTATFSLPRLERVGGDLAMLSTEFAAVAGTRASQGLTTFSLPSLATVGGSVDLRNAREMRVGDFQIHDFGLDALASVGADVRIHQEVFAARILGLRALTRIPRDLVFEGGRTDVDNDDLLPALTSVGRDVTLIVSRNARRFGTALVAVGRNVAIAPEASSFEPWRDEFLPALQNVGGDLALTGLSQPCGTSSLPSLRSVGGTLRVTGQVPEGSLGSTGAAPLVLGGFSMTTTAGSFVPLPPDASVSGKGPVAFVGNPDLCACQVEAFAAGLTARGWAGPLTNTGNAEGAACKPCPAPTCP